MRGPWFRFHRKAALPCAGTSQEGMEMAKIGFIGMGNMATAIMKGLLKEFSPEDMIFSSAHEEKMEQVTRETGVPHAGSNAECARQAK